MSFFRLPFISPRNPNTSLRQGSAPRKRIQRISLGYLITLLVLFSVNVSQPKAQAAYFWTAQERVPQYNYSTEEPPYLIADRNHTVHAFNSQLLNLDDTSSPKAVFYRQWTLENGWSYPIDVLIDPYGGYTEVIGVSADQHGNVLMATQMHGHDVYFSQTQLVSAGQPASWSEPILIAEGSLQVSPGIAIVAAITNDSDGENILVVYGGTNPNGLYFTSSSDHGMNWSVPYPIYLTGDETIIVKDPKLAVGENSFHAVWATTLNTGFGGPAYYANFDPVTQSWSEPLALDEPGIRTPAVIETQGKVIVSYHHINVNGNWWRISSDGGKTWSLPEQISPRHVGTNGAVSFAVDGADVLHAFFGQRIDDLNHGMWHVTFTGVTWTGLEAVVRGPQIRDANGLAGFDPRSARAVIVNGNTALVAWGTDGVAGTNGAWYSSRRLDAPELPIVPLEISTTQPAVIETPLGTLTMTEVGVTATTTAQNLEIFGDKPGLIQNPQTSIFAGILPAILLLAGMVLMFFLLQHKK